MDINNRKISKVVVDKDACIGAATCVVIAPKAFVLNSDGTVDVLVLGLLSLRIFGKKYFLQTPKV